MGCTIIAKSVSFVALYYSIFNCIVLCPKGVFTVIDVTESLRIPERDQAISRSDTEFELRCNDENIHRFYRFAARAGLYSCTGLMIAFFLGVMHDV